MPGPAIPPPQRTATDVSVILSNPHSNQAGGVFPTAWGSSFGDQDGLTGFQRMRDAPSSLTPAEAERIQKALWLAGYYGEEAIRGHHMPRWGTFSDADRKAWDSYLGDVMTYQGYTTVDGQTVKTGTITRTADELLNERMTQYQGVHAQALAAGGGYIPDEIIELTDPARIAVSARSHAQEALGRDLNPDEVTAVTAAVSGAERSNRTAYAQAQIDAQRRSMMAKQGFVGGESGMEFQLPPVITGGMGGSASTLADSLAERFLVSKTKGYVTPAQNAGGDAGFEKGLAFTYQGTPEQMKALREYLEAQNGDGKLVEKLEVNGAAVAKPLAPGEQAEVDKKKADEDKKTADAEKAVSVETIAAKHGVKILTPPADSPDGNTMPVVSGDAGAFRAFIDELGQHRGGGNAEFVAKLTGQQVRLNILGVGAGEMDTDENAVAAKQAIEQWKNEKPAAFSLGGVVREGEVAATGEGLGGAAAPTAQPAIETVTVHFREGAGMPKVEGLGFGGRADQYGKFLEAVNDPTVYSSGGSGRPYGMPDAIYRAVAGELGADGSNRTPEAAQAVARRYAERLFNKYGDWDKVAFAWVKGEGAMDSYDRQGFDIKKLDGREKQQVNFIHTAMSGAKPPEIDDRFKQTYGDDWATQAGMVGGGNVSVMNGFDASAEAQLAVEAQHAPEAQAYGTADAFTKFAAVLRSPVAKLGN